jgi:ferritin
MIGNKLNDALNNQMNKEFFAAYTYLAAVGYFEQEELGGFANFFRIQAQEEVQHALKIFSYMHQAGGRPVLETIKAPKKDFASPIAVFEYGLQSEQNLAGEISALLNLSISERHAPTQIFLQWFINEQVEEEALFTRAIKRLKLVGRDPNGLLLLDKEFSERAPDAKS